jgi:hypothetical protein
MTKSVQKTAMDLFRWRNEYGSGGGVEEKGMTASSIALLIADEALHG